LGIDIEREMDRERVENGEGQTERGKEKDTKRGSGSGFVCSMPRSRTWPTSPAVPDVGSVGVLCKFKQHMCTADMTSQPLMVRHLLLTADAYSSLEQFRLC
jgi:hypothetical protein